MEKYEKTVLGLGKSSVSEIKKVVTSPTRSIKDFIQIVNNVAHQLNPIGFRLNKRMIKIYRASIKSEASNILRETPEVRQTNFLLYANLILKALDDYNQHFHPNPLSLR